MESLACAALVPVLTPAFLSAGMLYSSQGLSSVVQPLVPRGLMGKLLSPRTCAGREGPSAEANSSS